MTVPHSRFEHGHGRRHTLAAATTWFAPATDGTHRRQPLREEVWGRISPGEPFHLTTAGAGWLFNLALLRERGIAIWGPDPDELVGPIPAARMRVALRELMEGWRAWLDGEPDLHDLGAQGYMLLTMCRARALAQTGRNLGKLEAAAWAERELPESASLIAKAIGWRRAAALGEPIAEDPDQTLPDVLNFVRVSINVVLGQAN